MTKLYVWLQPLMLVGALGISLILSGCPPPGWDLPEPESTGVDPLPGNYTFSQRGCFSVREAAGRKSVVFASDCFRFDAIEMEEGSFSHEHGEIGGTHCPTDAYAMAGSFTSATRAEGTIKYGFACEITEETTFIAELRSPANAASE